MKATRKMKRAMSLLAVVILLVTSMVIPVSAAPATGTITLTNDAANTHVSIAGKTYTAYKILDLKQNADHSTFAYTLNEGFAGLFSYTKFTTAFPSATVDETKTSTIYNFISGLTTATDVEKFANVIYEFTQDTANATTLANAYKKQVTVAAGAEQAVFSELPLGYYIIFGDAKSVDNGDVVSACALDTTTWDANAGTNGAYAVTISLKATVPTVDKEIVLNKGTASESNTKADSKSIGDTVDFRITSNVPDITGYTTYSFVVTDTLSKGLTAILDNDNKVAMTVKIGNATIASTNYTVAATTNAAGGTTITVTFNDFYNLVKGTYAKGTAITFDYSALINKDAVIGGDGNANTAKITYSNNPHTASSTADTKEDIVKEYVFKYQIYKYTDVGTANTPLAGAKFTLKKDATGATNIELIDNGDGTYRVATATEIADTPKQTVTTVVSTTDGNILISGLGAGKYILTETEAPEGYNLLEDTIKVNIAPTYSGNTLTDLTAAITGESYEKLSESEKIVGIKSSVENKSGVELPSTGGIGTTIFYIIGGILVAVALIAMTVKKLVKKSE